MTGIWPILLQYAWESAAAGFIGCVIAALWLGRGDRFSGAPVACVEDEQEQDDDTEAWDRGHDHDIDRRTGVSP